MNLARRIACIGLLACVPLAGGCNIGPRKLPVDGLEYNQAVRQSLQEQILLNLVRLRHGEPTEFLRVDAINAQHSVSRSGLVRGDLIEGGPDALALTGGVTQGESPVITFATTDNCEAFNRRLHVPLDLVTIHQLTESGWEIDRVMRSTFARVNGFSNAGLTTALGEPRYARDREGFEEVCWLLRDLQDQDRLRFRFIEHKEMHDGATMPITQLELEQIVGADEKGYEIAVADRQDHVRTLKRERWLAMGFLPEDIGAPEIVALCELLEVPPDSTFIEYRTPDVLQPDGSGKHQDEAFVEVETRSLFHVFRFLSQGVPLVPAGLPPRCLPPQSYGDPSVPLVVQVSERKPHHVCVAVCHCGRWFFLDPHDRDSVATFSMLVELYRIQITCEGTPGEQRPLLTIPLSTR